MVTHFWNHIPGPGSGVSDWNKDWQRTKVPTTEQVEHEEVRGEKAQQKVAETNRATIQRGEESSPELRAGGESVDRSPQGTAPRQTVPAKPYRSMTSPTSTTADAALDSEVRDRLQQLGTAFRQFTSSSRTSGKGTTGVSVAKNGGEQERLIRAEPSIPKSQQHPPAMGVSTPATTRATLARSPIPALSRPPNGEADGDLASGKRSLPSQVRSPRGRDSRTNADPVTRQVPPEVSQEGVAEGEDAAHDTTGREPQGGTSKEQTAGDQRAAAGTPEATVHAECAGMAGAMGTRTPQVHADGTRDGSERLRAPRAKEPAAVRRGGKNQAAGTTGSGAMRGDGRTAEDDRLEAVAPATSEGSDDDPPAAYQTDITRPRTRLESASQEVRIADAQYRREVLKEPTRREILEKLATFAAATNSVLTMTVQSLSDRTYGPLKEELLLRMEAGDSPYGFGTRIG